VTAMTTTPGTTGRADWRRAALTMYSPLSAILRHPPITVPLEASLRLTLEAMARQDVDTVVVIDPATRTPLGTFTLRDLVGRVTLPGGSLDQPVASVMTGGLHTAGPSTTAHEAALTMARLGVRTLVVVDVEGRLLGAVSRDDLFGLQRAGLDEVAEQIQASRLLADHQSAAAGIRRLAEGLLAQGTGAESLLHFITTLNDLLTIRIIETTADEHTLPGVAWCWIAMGSEGRLEQTFSTDQDNAIILDADEGEGDALRKAFVPFGRAVNERLRACGFPLCTGNYMAGNPRWCLTLGEWRRALAAWVAAPGPEALINACTFLDFRALYGQAALAERLRQPVLSMVADHTLFLRQLAAQAAESRPPLGLFGRFVYDGAPAQRRSIDLKQAGSRLFSDAARVLGLARRCPHTSTAERLRAVADSGLFSHERVGGIIDGLHFIHLLRLRNQIWPRRPRVGPNRIFPRDLNELDRHVLKEAFRQAGKLQEVLVMEYQLNG
jgi:CBS domain-containing protein